MLSAKKHSPASRQAAGQAQFAVGRVVVQRDEVHRGADPPQLQLADEPVAVDGEPPGAQALPESTGEAISRFRDDVDRAGQFTAQIPFIIGQAVEITEGPFADFSGTVEEVLPEKGKFKVSVSLFGRPTSVELDYLQLRAH